MTRSAYEESKILLNREKIDKVVADPSVDKELQRKLSLVLDARNFAIDHIGLNPKQSFTLYSKVNKDVLLWVLAASRPDSFKLYSWRFPIAGDVLSLIHI